MTTLTATLAPRAPEPARGSHSRVVAAAIAALHLAVACALLQMQPLRDAMAQAAPLFVQVLADTDAPATTPPAQTRATAVPPPQLTLSPPPLLAVTPAAPLQTITVAPAPVIAATDAPEVATPTSAPAPPAPVTAAVGQTATATAAAPGPRSLPASAVQYLVPPQVDYPRPSRRHRETGRALVRVLIDESGLPSRVEIEKSTGFARLDAAALAAVRKTRFKPYIENGRPQSGWALIPLSFDLDT